MTERTPITPQTKVAALLEAYPELEPVLLELSPKFEKLKNPLLRKTVARIATLAEVAVVGGVPVSRLVNRLREVAGLLPSQDCAETPLATAPAPSGKIACTLDVRQGIERGEHPLPQVMAALGRLKEGEVLELITPFVPAPLIDMAAKKGWRASSVTVDDETVRTFFSRE